MQPWLVEFLPRSRSPTGSMSDTKDCTHCASSTRIESSAEKDSERSENTLATTIAQRTRKGKQCARFFVESALTLRIALFACCFPSSSVVCSLFSSALPSFQHPHREYEIFSYVCSGALKHRDSMGNVESLGRGYVQFTSAGTGIAHSEHNDSQGQRDLVHFLQMWEG